MSTVTKIPIGYHCPECGHTTSCLYAEGEILEQEIPCGRYDCDAMAEIEPNRGSVAKVKIQRNRGGRWPVHSTAMAVSPEQIPEAEAHARSIGIPTEFDEDGCPILRSQKHKKEYAEAIGFYDLNGGYSDPQPGNKERWEDTEKDEYSYDDTEYDPITSEGMKELEEQNESQR